MPSINEVFGNSELLKGEDLQGREPCVVIATVKPKEFDDGNKLVVTFQNAKKTWICNKTNASAIAYLYGEDYTEWVGREIVLWHDPTVMYAGKRMGGIRVKPPVKRDPGYQVSSGGPNGVKTVKNQAPAEPGMDDQIPF